MLLIRPRLFSSSLSRSLSLSLKQWLSSSFQLFNCSSSSSHLLLAVDALEGDVSACARGRGRLGRRQSRGRRREQDEEGERRCCRDRRSASLRRHGGVRRREFGIEEFAPFSKPFTPLSPRSREVSVRMDIERCEKRKRGAVVSVAGSE